MTSENASYKFTSIDKSIIYNSLLSKVLDKYVEYLPTWLAPNVITVFGGACIVLNTLLVILIDPNLESNRFVSLLSALLLQLYSFADSIDGKQARRTKSCSSLGQLMDHGIDSMVLILSSFMVGSNFGIGYPDCLIYLFPGIMNFFMVTLSEFYTKVFSLWYVNGPTEGIYSTILMYLMISIFSKNILNFLFRNILKIKIRSKFFQAFLKALKNNLFSNFNSFEIVTDKTDICRNIAETTEFDSNMSNGNMLNGNMSNGNMLNGNMSNGNISVGNISNGNQIIESVIKGITVPDDNDFCVEMSILFISMILSMFILSFSSIYSIISNSVLKLNKGRLCYEIFLPYLYLFSILFLVNNLPRKMKSFITIIFMISLTFTNQVIRIIYSHLRGKEYIDICPSSIMFILIGFFSSISVSYHVLYGFSVFLVYDFCKNANEILFEMTNGYVDSIFVLKSKTL
ncbi:hypothetical protein DMUE_3352 [Dictyocoela muelleri]|nr:hypothetical protein DMUE_3352 [Dictyocoela muelleri]